MKLHIFYRKYANVPLNKRYQTLSFAHNDLLFRQTLDDVYVELKNIGDRIRPDLIRQEELLEAVEKYLTKPKHSAK